MKNLFQNLAVLFFALSVLFMVSSCEDNSLDEPVNTNTTQITEFKESKLISFDEIERITSRVLPGEMSYTPVNQPPLERRNKNASRENTTYYFYATIEGDSRAGENLSGELQVSVTMYSGLFKLLRGKFVAADGEESETRGAILADGTVYLIIEMKDEVLVYGTGIENATTKGITGSFTTYIPDGPINQGSWIANPKDMETPSDTIVDILTNDRRGRFTTLTAALDSAALSDTLRGGIFTVFAPTDAAFEALDAIPEGEALRNALLHHVVNGKLDTRAINTQKTLTPLFGDDLTIGFNGALFTVNETVQIIHSNVEASNGYIHVIDAVLVP